MCNGATIHNKSRKVVFQVQNISYKPCIGHETNILLIFISTLSLISSPFRFPLRLPLLLPFFPDRDHITSTLFFCNVIFSTLRKTLWMTRVINSVSFSSVMPSMHSEYVSINQTCSHTRHSRTECTQTPTQLFYERKFSGKVEAINAAGRAASGGVEISDTTKQNIRLTLQAESDAVEQAAKGEVCVYCTSLSKCNAMASIEPQFSLHTVACARISVEFWILGTCQYRSRSSPPRISLQCGNISAEFLGTSCPADSKHTSGIHHGLSTVSGKHFHPKFFSKHAGSFVSTAATTTTTTTTPAAAAIHALKRSSTRGTKPIST